MIRKTLYRCKALTFEQVRQKIYEISCIALHIVNIQKITAGMKQIFSFACKHQEDFLILYSIMQISRGNFSRIYQRHFNGSRDEA